MNISEYRFEVTKTLNNIKQHDYTVSDYKMCKSEANIVSEALERYLTDLKYDEELRIIDAKV